MLSRYLQSGASLTRAPGPTTFGTDLRTRKSQHRPHVLDDFTRQIHGFDHFGTSLKPRHLKSDVESAAV